MQRGIRVHCFSSAMGRLFDRQRVTAGAVALLISLFGPNLEARPVRTASLTLSVTDQSQAVVPGAFVQCFVGQREAAAKQTGRDGTVTFDLAPNIYGIRIQAQGFDLEKAQLRLVAGSSEVRHIFLKVSSCSECLRVSYPVGHIDPANYVELFCRPTLDDAWIPYVEIPQRIAGP